MKGKFMIIAAMLGALTFGACVDNNESASVENVRNAKAEELKAQAALLNAEAQAKVILANAEAALKASQAAINQAEAAIKEAQARLAEAQAEAKEIENEGKLAELQAKIAEYEATIAYQQMLKAKWVAQMETDAIKAEEQLLEAQLNLIAQEEKFNQKLEQIAEAEAQELRNLYHDYVTESAKLTRAIGKVNQLKNTIAQAEAGIIDAEVLAAATILDIEEDIATWETEIAAYQAVLDVYMEAHADEILSDEEVIKLTNEAYVELAKLVEAQGVAGDALAAAQKAVTEASKPVAALAKDKEAPYQVMVAAMNDYKFAVTSLVQAAGLDMYDDLSDATGLDVATAWGYYSNDAVTGKNSVFNSILVEPKAYLFANTDKEDEIYDGTYEYELATLNKTNLDALAALMKDVNYSEEAIEELTEAVADAEEAEAAAKATYEAAVKAVADTKAADKAAKAAVKAANAAWDAACVEMEAKKVELEETTGLKAAKAAKKVAEDAYVQALAMAEALFNNKSSFNTTNYTYNASDIKTGYSVTDVEARIIVIKEKSVAYGLAINAVNTAEGAYTKAVEKAHAAIIIPAWDAKNAAAAAAVKAAADYAYAQVALGVANVYDDEGDLVGTDHSKDTYTVKKWDEETASYVVVTDKKGAAVVAYTAIAGYIQAQADTVAAKADLEKAQDGAANFDEKVAEALAEVEATEDAFEAAVKAYNEAFEAADKGVVAAKAVKKEAQDAYDAAAKAVAEMRTYISTITKYNVSHKDCASAIAALESAIAALEKNIENAEAKIETVEAKTADFEAQIAAAEAQMEQAELLVEVETIYAEAAKAALDAALAEYAQSGETEE